MTIAAGGFSLGRGRRARVALSLASSVAVAAASPLAAQESRSLQPGERSAGRVAAETPARYTMQLDAETFVYGEVAQTGADVAVSVRDPDGGAVGTFDAFSTGAEPFVFETKAGGAYTIEVAPFEDQEGSYEIVVIDVEPIAEEPAARVDQLMRIHDGDDRPGGVVAIARGGELTFARAYGMANLTHGVPWKTNTVSNIGSVTKQFTAMGLLLLQADGKLSIDDDIREHIPELPDFGTPVTLRHFLNHTSGYREVYNLLPMTGYNGEDTFAREKAIQIVRRQPELQGPPNTEWNYNNTGFILLSLVVERTTGQSFAEYMRQNVFEPLGMSDTRVKMVQGQVIPGSAQGYAATKPGRFRATRDLAASAGAGGIYTTADDLLRWLLNTRDATLGGREAITEIATTAVLESGDSTGYGLGLAVSKLGGRTIYAHTGGDVAHRAYLSYFPEFDGGVIVMSNRASFDLGLGARIARLFFASELEEDDEAVAAENESAEAESAEAEGIMPPSRMEAIAGRWVIDVQGLSLDAEITAEEGRLYFQATGQPRAEARATSDSTVAIAAAQAEFTFRFDADGTTDAAVLRQGGGEMPMRRSAAAALSEDELRAYAGRYFSEELEIFYEITLEEGDLVLHHLDLEPATLSHREGEEFSSSQTFLATIVFERAGNGRVRGFTVSNGRTKGVRFRRH